MTESKTKSNSDQKVKVFSDLVEDVINKNMCCACGACVSYCESQSFDVIQMDGSTPKFKGKPNEENCTECGLCYYICPQTDPLLEKLKEVYCIEDGNGPIIDVLAAKTTDKAIEEVGQDGGVVTALLAHLFDKHKIDAAIVSEKDANWQTIPKMVFNKEELVKSSGTRYSISSQLLPLKDLYNIPLEILKEKGIFDIEQLRVAFVGTPCQCRAIAKMKLLNIKPAHVVKYNISLFCFENFDYEDLYKLLEKETKVKRTDIQKTWIKKNFFVRDKKGKEYEVPIKKLDPAVRNHCHHCDEYTGRFSDISVGAQGAPLGYSFIIIRTETGEQVIKTLLSEGLIEQHIVPVEESAEWKTSKLNWLIKLLSFKTK